MFHQFYKTTLAPFAAISLEIEEKAKFTLLASICAIGVAILSIIIHSFFDFKWHLVIGDYIGLICYTFALVTLGQHQLSKSMNLLVGGVMAALFTHNVIGDFIMAENLSPYKVYHTLMIQMLILIYVGIVAVRKQQVIAFGGITFLIIALHFLVLLYSGVPFNNEFIALFITIQVESVLASVGILFFHSFSSRVLRNINRQTNIIEEQHEEILRKNEAIQKQNNLLEKKVEERTAALVKSNEELKLFSYVVSHDLREPLRMISSFLGLVQREINKQTIDRVNLYEFTKFAIDGSQRLDRMITDLLRYINVNRQEQKTFGTVDMNDVIEIVKLNLKILIQDKEAIIEIEDLPSVHAKEQDMVLLFQNLISNAIKYSQPDKIPVVFISGETVKDKVFIKVEDNGLGMESSVISNIFQPFRRGKRRNGASGTGIGLAICKKVIESHNGQITVTSTVGEGSIFEVELWRPSVSIPIKKTGKIQEIRA